jgi:hypothetical protein
MRPHFLLPILLACTSATKAPAEGDNSAPSIEIVAPDYGSNFTIEENIDFLASVSDEESNNETLMVSWTSDLNGDLSAELADESGNASLESDPLIAGGHTITATAIDPDGAQTSVSILVNIIDPGMPPEIALLSPDDDEVGVAGELLTLEAIVEDPDNSLEDLSVTFSISGEDVNSMCDDQPDGNGVAQCQLTIDAHGIYTVIAQVTDPMGQTGTDTLEDFEIIAADAHDGDGDGFAEIDGDCDDANASTHPDALEVPDGIDNNCDGQIDEGTHTADDDGDGFTELDGDCDDTDGSIFPGAMEYLDGVDGDCDGEIDEGTVAYDDDGDCFCEGDEDTTDCTGSISEICDVDALDIGDCNDADEDINPDAIERCDAIDDDCDTLIGSEDPDTDKDHDGYSACDALDCDDDDSSVHPDATETCNEVDDDCNGVVDDDAEDASTWHLDSDGDGFGSESATTTACSAPPSYVADGTDCNDSDFSINPDATEVCDEEDTDEDCSGSADGWDASGKSYWYLDLDGDGYPTVDIYEYRCDAYGSYIAGTGWWDCDDSRSDINPGMPERCDYFDLDEDCDGEINEPGAEDGAYFYRDWDRDGYGDPMEMEMLCEAGDLTYYDVTNNDDCCDYNAAANPDATDYKTITNGCGSYDWDCDGDETKQWTNTGSCGYCLTACCAEPPGWRYSTEPDCGDYADWVYDCSYSFPASCSKDYGAKTQACR